MIFSLIALPQSVCGASYRVPECYYCVLQHSCDVAENVKALWVLTTHRA